MVSEKFVQQAVGGSNADALGQKITLTINKMPYTFYISGVYKYVEDSYASMFGSTSDDDIQTEIYIPLDVARRAIISPVTIPAMTAGPPVRPAFPACWKA